MSQLDDDLLDLEIEEYVDRVICPDVDDSFDPESDSDGEDEFPHEF